MHESSNVDKQFLSAPIKSTADKFQLIPEFLKVGGFMKEHIDSYNYFVSTGIKKIVAVNREVRSFVDPQVYLKFNDVKIGEPCILEDGVPKKLKPHSCRLTNMSYTAPILARIEHVIIEGGKKKLQETKDVTIGRMPVMLRSCCCVLNGKCESELVRLGECPLDPGGYFIVKGNEKLIVMQEQLSNNRIIVEFDTKKNLSASVTSMTATFRSKTVITMEKGKMYLVLNRFQGKVPIFVVMKAMGFESLQEIVQMVGRDPSYSSLLLPSIEECVNFGVHTRQQALEFLQKKLKTPQYPVGLPEKDSAFMVLRDVFLAHVPVHKNNFHPKCAYVAVMLRRLLDVSLGKDTRDDKDYVGNKRFELSGQLLSLLFEDLFKTMVTELRKAIDVDLSKPKSRVFDCLRLLSKNYITNGLERSISTGNWCARRFRVDRKGVTEVLGRQSFIQCVGALTKIQPQFGRTNVSGPRALQPSQWGMLCPCDTPEGASCGLIKNLALMAHVTTEEDEVPLMSLCFFLGVENMERICAEQLHSRNSFLVIFNGNILGKHRRPQRFASNMRRLRRDGNIPEFISVFVNEKQRCVYIASDGGRVCRPLVIADKGISRVKQHHMKELLDGALTFDDFLHQGLVEYLDVNEENNALIALYEESATPETTHIEIEPLTILGVCAGLIPFPHHNQSPRNTYQCAMGKQAMGNVAYNQLYRMDTMLNFLVYPQRPLLTTKTIELVHYDKLGAGQNATVAVMSYSGYDIEDAIVMNKASLDRGFGRCIVMKKNSTDMKRYENNATEIIVPPIRNFYSDEKLHALDVDGIASPGQIVKQGSILVNKEIPLITRAIPMSRFMPDGQYKSEPLRVSKISSETAVLDRVALFSDKDNNLCVNLMLRETRRPEVGDKFSSRHGQKGVCGTIVDQEDFVFSETGICPDLIMNPHGFPSRMTVGKMIELLGAKSAAFTGKFHYGSAFGEQNGLADNVEAMGETLVKHKFNYNGKDFLYSGITGSPLHAYIFMGPVYYQKLKHMVVDKMHARANGRRVLLTRQPTEGKGRNGGLRIGEMERDSLVAYGASSVLYERMMYSSDPFQAHVCGTCGLLGYYSHSLKAGMCSSCKKGDNVSTISLPYACKLLFQELQSMNIVPRLKLVDA